MIQIAKMENYTNKLKMPDIEINKLFFIQCMLPWYSAMWRKPQNDGFDRLPKYQNSNKLYIQCMLP
jgi:hypothetical protein